MISEYEMYRAIQFMIKHGGTFVHHLARAWEAADPKNRMRLYKAFERDFVRYSNLASAYAEIEK